MNTNAVPRIAVTAGEPAGIGPELLLALTRRDWPAELVACADATLLAERAEHLGIPVELQDYDPGIPATRSEAGRLLVAHSALDRPADAGRLDPANSRSVLDRIDRACDGCLSGEFDAMVTGPVHKAVINDAGIAFSGHTEYLADRCAAPMPVMLLVADKLRVALVTTHLALRDVPDAITRERLNRVARILDNDLQRWFGLKKPRIAVLGLNPHAGESGHLGLEEIDVIEPVCNALRADCMDIRGPLPADTAFTPPQLEQVDAVLAMYHDQGLTVLKYASFGRAVNVTLGLPIRRTSVDHGTALDLAGTGRADAGSFVAATELAISMSARQSK